ncbi:hypothetical protein AB0C12_42980 [Actinoplanes sp. NPDC048967]|uniref:hypothetical protein n=1 Tax=Actinoplanes sp. NPDC048967 TaxID=3155269 RepID=UPI003401B188
MPSEIFTHLNAATEAAAAQLAQAEADAAVAHTLLDDLATAKSTATRALPPDTSVRVLRRYVDEDGRAMVEIEVDLDDDLAAYLDTLPDPNAFIEKAIWHQLNKSTGGRYAYYRQLNVAAALIGLRVGWSADLDAWMDHHPKPPRRLTAGTLTAHAAWLNQRREPAQSRGPSASNATATDEAVVGRKGREVTGGPADLPRQLHGSVAAETSEEVMSPELRPIPRESARK